MYTAMTPPEIVAIPPTIIASSSDCVMRGTYGLTMIGASVWPMKTLAAADSVSAPLVRIRLHHRARHQGNDKLQDAEVVQHREE